MINQETVIAVLIIII